ncbi:MAG TPA: hypothetical protein VGH29_15370, partial [Candidatus Binataceae bacterium]
MRTDAHRSATHPQALSAGLNQTHRLSAAFDEKHVDLDTVQCGGTVVGGIAGAEKTVDGRNDVFSFWKLPAAWRPGVEELIEESEQQARHFLFEQYLD